MPKELTDRQLEVYETYLEQECNEAAAAEKLGISITGLRKNLYLCARKGKHIAPDRFSPAAPPGFGMFMSTVHTKGGEEVERWDRIKPLAFTIEQAAEYLRHRVPLSDFLPAPPKVNGSLMLEWTVADLHYGMHAWGKEGGDDYDIKIARELLLDSGSDIFARSGKVKRAALVFTGDNIHTDFKSNQTERNRNPLDVDGRYGKLVETGIEVFTTVIEMALTQAEEVVVIVMFGNHDNHSSIWLQWLLHYHFRNNPRVKVDLSPAKARFLFWGCSGFIYHHGDETKPDRVCAELLLHIARNNVPGVKFFYAKQGHLHREEIKDINGVTFEYIPSPVARDSWTAASLYNSRRATVASLYDLEFGEQDRFTVTPYGLKRRAEMLAA